MGATLKVAELTDNVKKVRIVARKMSFLMPHQKVLPDLKEVIDPLHSDESSQYLSGAYDALNLLIDFLAEKGPPIKK